MTSGRNWFQGAEQVQARWMHIGAGVEKPNINMGPAAVLMLDVVIFTVVDSPVE